jgi:hypothetical protein
MLIRLRNLNPVHTHLEKSIRSFLWGSRERVILDSLNEHGVVYCETIDLLTDAV